MIVLSDFFDDVSSLAAGLKHFRHRRHDVVLLHVLDPAELDFPFRGPTEFKGLEEFPEVQADPAGDPPGLSARAGAPFGESLEQRLPPPAHRLFPAADRSAARCGPDAAFWQPASGACDRWHRIFAFWQFGSAGMLALGGCGCAADSDSPVEPAEVSARSPGRR